MVVKRAVERGAQVGHGRGQIARDPAKTGKFIAAWDDRERWKHIYRLK